MIDPIAHGLPHFVEVKPDPSFHGTPSAGEHEDRIRRYLDTAYNLLRELAVRNVFEALRESGELGDRTDEEAFASVAASGDPEAPTSYLDLAPDSKVAQQAFLGAFAILEQQALVDAAAGLGLDEEGN